MLDQPAHDIIRLEAILRAHDKYEELQEAKSKTRGVNRARHAPVQEHDNTV